MAAEQRVIVPTTNSGTGDWRSDREKAGWCRCGKREDEPMPGCTWHAARAERA
jgi:hypothetical protein